MEWQNGCKGEPVDDYGDDYGLRGDCFDSFTVVVAVVVNRNREKTEREDGGEAL